MKNYSAPALLLLLVFTSNRIYAQTTGAGYSFPTYQQIKPSDSEIIDYVPKQGKSEYANKVIINIFDNPDRTVTYILNGKPTTDSKYAKELLSRKEVHIDNINIEQPTSDGKKTIQINYSTKQ